MQSNHKVNLKLVVVSVHLKFFISTLETALIQAKLQVHFDLYYICCFKTQNTIATTEPDKATTVPYKATTVQDKATTVPDIATTEPDKATKKTDKATTVPDKATKFPDKAVSLQQMFEIRHQVPNKAHRAAGNIKYCWSKGATYFLIVLSLTVFSSKVSPFT